MAQDIRTRSNYRSSPVKQYSSIGHAQQLAFEDFLPKENKVARPEQFQNADPAIKAELKIGKNVCQCTGCEAFFTGPSVFDRHLYLTADNEAPPVCLSPAEMRAIGMTQNVHGVWQYGVPKKLAGAA